MNTRIIWGALLAFSMVSGCQMQAQMQALKKDLSELQSGMRVISGDVSSAGSSPVVLVVLDGEHATEPTRLLVTDSAYKATLPVTSKPVWIFAFGDTNGNFKLDADEPRGWANAGMPIGAAEKHFHIDLRADETIRVPEALSDGRALDWSAVSGLAVNMGTITDLRSAHLSLERAHEGLWQPLAFLKEGGAGIHFMAPYRDDREPVLFVHGMEGAPIQFEYLIKNLDRTRYQAWVFSYPSGLPLDAVSQGLHQLVIGLQYRYRFETLHVVAHSMGGLVSRGFINQCAAQRDCDFLKSFTTIATPWGGNSGAALGVRYAPTAIPAWFDIAPDSDYLKSLFMIPLPKDVPHTLFVTFNKDDAAGARAIASQLRYEAQRESRIIFGINDTHVGVLSNPLMAAGLNEALHRRDNPLIRVAVSRQGGEE